MPNFEQTNPAPELHTEPKTWTVRRSSGELESGWVEAKRETGPDGVIRVEVTKPAEDGGEYVKTIPLDKLEAIAQDTIRQNLGEGAMIATDIVAAEPSTVEEPAAQEIPAVSDEERAMQIRSSKNIIRSLKAVFETLGLETITRSAADVIDDAATKLEGVRTEVGYAKQDPYGVNQETLRRYAILKDQLAQQRSKVSYGMTDYELETEIKKGLQELGIMHRDLISKLTTL